MSKFSGLDYRVMKNSQEIYRIQINEFGTWRYLLECETIDVTCHYDSKPKNFLTRESTQVFIEQNFLENPPFSLNAVLEDFQTVE